MHWVELGRFLIIVGIALAVIGCLFLMVDKIPLGRLPGDLNFGKNNFRVSIPITTCILISVLLTLIVNFFSRK
jgi:hypothetical protein